MFDLSIRPRTLYFVHMVQTMKEMIGGSYPDYFMLSRRSAFEEFGYTVKLLRGVFFRRFGLVFPSSSLLLVMVYQNVGLGLRQKKMMMMMPGFIAFYAALLAYWHPNLQLAMTNAQPDARLKPAVAVADEK